MSDENEIHWGTALWHFFHVLANKIKPESFHIIRVELLQFIQLICNNIDCGKCRNHAIEYLEKNNFMQINSVNEFKNFFFTFHNTSNFDKQTELFLIDDLSKYDSFVLSTVLQNILKYDYIFDNELELFNEINNWFSKNNKYFDY